MLGAVGSSGRHLLVFSEALRSYNVPQARQSALYCWPAKGWISRQGPLGRSRNQRGRSSQAVLETGSSKADVQEEVHHLRVPDSAPAPDGHRLERSRSPTAVEDSPEPSSSSIEPAEGSGGGLPDGKVVGAIVFGLGLVALIAASAHYKGEIKHFLDFFIELVETWGFFGYVAYGLVYCLLEVLAVPAIPLTMTAGVIFGIVPGVALVSVAGTVAATISFLIARYFARDKVLELAQKNTQFTAVDRAIGQNGFKVVTLLRLSPLLPLALSNYFYGLTSVDLTSYVAGSWLGMFPGTLAYVSAGNYGRDFLEGVEGSGGVHWWQLAIGLGFTLGSLLYVGRVAQQALEEADATAKNPPPE